MKKNGGKVLGKGSYGCVFLGSPIENEQKDKLVKIMLDPDDFYKEIKNMGIIRLLNKENNYSIYNESFLITNISKELSKLKKKDLDHIKQCELDTNIIKKKKRIYQIIYSGDNKGEDLHKIVKRRGFSINKIFSLSYTLYLTLREYSIAGIIHKDIKINNIIKLDNKLYFIDFGLMTTIDNLFSKYFNYNHKYSIFYAPEFTLFYVLNKKLNLQDFINLVLDNFDKKFYNIYPEKNMINDLTDMYNFYNSKLQKNNNIYSLFTDEDKKKIDLYSLSITLLISYFYYYTNSSKNNNFINKIILPSICLNNQKRLSIDKILKLFTPSL